MSNEITYLIFLLLVSSIFAGNFFYLDWWMTKKSKERPKKKEG